MAKRVREGGRGEQESEQLKNARERGDDHEECNGKESAKGGGGEQESEQLENEKIQRASIVFERACFFTA